ncbi:MAG: RNA-binding protein [Desulfitibacter sp. BRH_c19]|nr:MAG: RNA-binding protein [Desulfitibacter sp. BRH_c19]
MEEVKISTDTIQLNQFLKWANIVSSGGEAKILINEGHIKVNDSLEKRRSKKLNIGDIIAINNQLYKIIK